MTHVLAQRKYRLAARLTTGTAKTFGLVTVAAFIGIAIGSAVMRAVNGGDQEFSYWVIQAIPLAVAASSWIHLARSYPSAIANGMTRKEFLTGFALFGAVTVLAAAAFTQLAILALGLAATSDDAASVGFYGQGLLESVARPALYFALGAAVAAALHRFGNRALGGAVSGLMVAVVFFRMAAVSFIVLQVAARGDGVLVEVPVTMDMTDLALIDLGLAALFTLLTWTFLARAPMRPKKA